MKIALKLQPGAEGTRLSDAVYDTLFDAILTGRLAPGAIVRFKQLRIVVAPACSETSSRTRGRSLEGARIVSPPAVRTRRAFPTPRR